MADMADLRSKFLTESIETAGEPRWGYFGIPGPLCIGDDSMAPLAKRKVMKEGDDSGDPIRNIQAAVLKKGNTPDVYFQFSPPLCSEPDPYMDPGRAIKDKVWMIGGDEKFKPPGKIKMANKLGYEYIPHMDSAKDPQAIYSQYKDFMPPRQIYSNPLKKGQGLTPNVLFGIEGKFPEHMADDYDCAREQRKKELKIHNDILAKKEQAFFRPGDYGNQCFQDNSVYHCTVPTHVPREPKVENNNALAHENAFKPANPMKKGYPVGAQPEWIPDPMREPVKRKPKADDGPPAFRVGAPNAVCNPMPSVTTNMRNMRCERPSSFARPSL